jgi:hypothetical protein
MFGFIKNLFKKLAKNKPASQAPLMDDEMHRLMKLETLWPLQSMDERKEAEGLRLRGAGDRLNAYFNKKTRFDSRGLNLPSEQFAYYWTG